MRVPPLHFTHLKPAPAHFMGAHPTSKPDAPINPDKIKPWVFDANRKPVLAELTPITRQDAKEVEGWFSDTPNSETPTYTDEKYHQWWLTLIQQNGKLEAGTKTLALRINNKILGMLFIEERQLDHFDNQVTTLLRGMRVAPEVNSSLNKNAPYKGIGKALLVQALCESFRLGTTGIGLTSSHGVEEYYSSIFGEPVMSRQHTDDPIGTLRQYYILKGDARIDKLRELQTQSENFEQESFPSGSVSFQGYLGLN